MRIEVLKIKDLIPFIESDLYKSFEELPITKLRAISQANNPRASADDPALLIALNDQNKITSYIGFLPDTLQIGEKTQKIFSNSCWWAKKDCNDNGAMQLFFLGCKLTNNQLFFPDLTPHTKQLLGSMKAFTLRKIDYGICGYLKMDLANILPTKKQYFSRFKTLLTAFDSVVNVVYRPLKWIWKLKTANSNLNYEIVENIDAEIAGFIRENNKNELFQRAENEINWVLNYPWVTTNPTDKTKSYAFSYELISFKTIPVRVYNYAGLVAFFMLLEHDGKVHIPYFYSRPEIINDTLKILYKLLLDNDVHTFTSFQRELNTVIRSNPHPFLHLRKRSKVIAFSKNIEAEFDSKVLQDGDGDCAFI